MKEKNIQMKMKKILIALVLGAVAYAGSKKKENTVSQIVTVSYPVVTITGQQYFSVNVGDPLPTVTAVAYDTFYRDSLPVVIDYAGVDNTTAGLYVVNATAKNRYGHVGVSQVYFAVTNVSDDLDITGWYMRSGDPNRSAYVSKLGRGLFMTSNVGGVDTTKPSTGPVVSAVFAVTDLITLDFGTQQVLDNGVWTTLTGLETQELNLTPPDTTLNYDFDEANFGPQVRTFVKQ